MIKFKFAGIFLSFVFPLLAFSQSKPPAEIFELAFKEGEPYISQLYNLEDESKYWMAGQALGYEDLDYRSEMAAEVVSSYPQFYGGYYVRGTLYVNELNLPKDAIKDFEKALRFNPDFWPAYRNLAMAYAKTGAFEKANEAISKALAITPEKASIYQVKASVHVFQQNIDAASEAIRKAMELDPENLTYQVKLARLHWMKNEQDKALVILNKVLEQNREIAEAHLVKAHIFWEKGEIDKVIDHCDQGIFYAGPEFTAALSTLMGKALLVKGDKQAAINNLSFALKYNPQNVQNYYLIGWIALTMKDYERALENFNFLTDNIGKKYPEVQFSRGIVHYEREDYKKAQADFEAAISNAKKDTEYHVMLGKVLKKQGDSKKACKAWKKAVKQEGHTSSQKEEVRSDLAFFEEMFEYRLSRPGETALELAATCR